MGKNKSSSQTNMPDNIKHGDIHDSNEVLSDPDKNKAEFNDKARTILENVVSDFEEALYQSRRFYTERRNNEEGEIDPLIKYFERFKGKETEIAVKLIKAGHAYSIVSSLYAISNLNNNAIAIACIESTSTEDILSPTDGWIFQYILEKLPDVSPQDLVIKMIECGHGDAVVSRFLDVSGIDHGQLVRKLIDAGNGDRVACYLPSFKNVNYKEIALDLITSGLGKSVTYYIKNFPSSDHRDIALGLIGSGQGHFVSTMPDSFTGITHAEIAEKLIETDQINELANNIGLFKVLPEPIIIKLIEAGKISEIADNISTLGTLSNRVATALIKNGKECSIFEHMDQFPGVSRQDLASQIIQQGKGKSVLHNLELFSGLEQEIVFQMIESQQGFDVLTLLPFIQKYPELSNLDRVVREEIAWKLIDMQEGKLLMQNFNEFSQVSQQELVKRLIASGQSLTVSEYIRKFSDLDPNTVAEQLIDDGHIDALLYNFRGFTGLHQSVADKLLSKGHDYYVAAYLDHFTDLNYIQVAGMLSSFDNRREFLESLQKIASEDELHIITEMVKSNGASAVVHNMHTLSKVSHSEVASLLLTFKREATLADGLYKFNTGELDNQIAIQLIKAGHGDSVLRNGDKFVTGLDNEIALEFIKSGKGNYITSYPENFTDLDPATISKAKEE